MLKIRLKLIWFVFCKGHFKSKGQKKLYRRINIISESLGGLKMGGFSLMVEFHREGSSTL